MRYQVLIFLSMICCLELVGNYDGYLELVQEDIQEQKSPISLWTTGYMRSADKAYVGNSFCKQPLSMLLFAQSCFPLRNAFANCIVESPSNVWINLTNLCPIVEYSEKGVQIGLEYGHDTFISDHPFRFGVRALLPVKSLKMTRCYTSQSMADESSGINQVRCLSTEVVSGPDGQSTIDNSFAYRLDFFHE